MSTHSQLQEIAETIRELDYSKRFKEDVIQFRTVQERKTFLEEVEKRITKLQTACGKEKERTKQMDQELTRLRKQVALLNRTIDYARESIQRIGGGRVRM